jgi:hypothetical protein
MIHAQKPDLVFRRNGRVYLNRQGRQFSRLLAGELRTSACRVCTARASLQSCDAYGLPTPFSCFPFTSLPVRHRVPSHFKRSLPFVVYIRFYLLMMDIDKPETCRSWRNILRISCESSWFFFTQLQDSSRLEHNDLSFVKLLWTSHSSLLSPSLESC